VDILRPTAFPAREESTRPLRIGSFEFNLREFVGSRGGFGTLLPLVLGYITVCKTDPSGLLVMMGLASILTRALFLDAVCASRHHEAL